MSLTLASSTTSSAFSGDGLFGLVVFLLAVGIAAVIHKLVTEHAGNNPLKWMFESGKIDQQNAAVVIGIAAMAVVLFFSYIFS